MLERDRLAEEYLKVIAPIDREQDDLILACFVSGWNTCEKRYKEVVDCPQGSFVKYSVYQVEQDDLKACEKRNEALVEALKLFMSARNMKGVHLKLALQMANEAAKEALADYRTEGGR